ncbi:MAG: hypothetical protein BWY11_00887 [Firmicutes bacterium ADurb.Bin182]|nr:MAG: hypothetical protein BWY11_00887 [Firmicutes bacterium ADurb.Bin182]
MKLGCKGKITLVIAICLAVIMVAGLVNVAVCTNNGNVVVKEVVISPYGSDLAATMYIPRWALETDEQGNFKNQAPAVIVCAGFTNSRTFLDNVAIELSRAGFVVMNIDQYGHHKSEATHIRGYGVEPSPMSDTSQIGTTDALAYLRTLGFVDQTRIGATGHSLGAGAAGNVSVNTAGFYTLQDKLIIMLNETFGVAVTAEDVAAQDADAIAAKALDAAQLEHYETKKAAITEEYDRAVRDIFLIDGGAATDPKVVEVAGIPVWRDLQANFGRIAYIGGNGAGGTKNPDAHISNDATKKAMSADGAVERDMWYEINLSGTQERVLSTKLSDFFGEPTDAIRKAAEGNSLRMLDTPWGWHGIAYFNVPTVKAAVQFFRTTMDYNNGVALNGTTFLTKDVFSALGAIALLVLVIYLVKAIMKLSFFESMKAEPIAPIQDKKSPVFWIFMLICVLGPPLTYCAGVGWVPSTGPSLLATVVVATRISFWSIIIALALLALTVVKYFLFDKKKGVGYFEMYGLKYSRKNIGKSIVLALSVFACVAVLLAVYYNLFAFGNLKITVIGATVFQTLSTGQYYSCLLYAILFLPFYLVNSMIVNSSRLKGMSEKANTLLFAFINCSGMLLLLLTQFFIGLARTGSVVFKAPPGSSAVLYSIAVLIVTLFVSAIFTRKLYLKTGSSIPGALLNSAVFVIPAIQAYMNYTFL